MADILRIAKERREALAAEVARVDEFIRMAEALNQDSQSQIPALHGSTPKTALPEKGPAAVTAEVVREAPRQVDTNVDSHAAADAPRLLLPHYAYEADRSGTGALSLGPARAPSSSSTFGAYLEVLREGIRQHFKASRNVAARVDAKWVQRLLVFGKTAWAACHPRGTGILPIGRQSAFVAALLEGIRRHFGNAPTAPALASPAAAVLLPGPTDKSAPASSLLRNPARAMFSLSAPDEGGRALVSGATHKEQGAVLPERQVGSAARMAGALDQLRTREKSAARSLDIHLGQKVRQRRWMLGMSRQRLAHHLGVTRIQIEKFETGAEQIDVTRLCRIAAVLEVQTFFFFEGLDIEAPDAADARAELLFDEEAPQQLEAFSDDTFIFSLSRSA